MILCGKCGAKTDTAIQCVDGCDHKTVTIIDDKEYRMREGLDQLRTENARLTEEINEIHATGGTSYTRLAQAEAKVEKLREALNTLKLAVSLGCHCSELEDDNECWCCKALKDAADEE